MVIVGRPINDISINGLEWLLDKNNEPIRFSDSNMAKLFLLNNMVFIENIYSYWLENEETGLRFNIC
jgi:hypothetical protein